MLDQQLQVKFQRFKRKFLWVSAIGWQLIQAPFMQLAQSKKFLQLIRHGCVGQRKVIQYLPILMLLETLNLALLQAL